MTNKNSLKEYLQQGIRDAYEGNIRRMQLKDTQNPLQLPLMALAWRIKTERECVSERPNFDKIVIGGKCALCMEEQVERESGLRLGEYMVESNSESPDLHIEERLVQSGDYINLLFVAARSIPNDEIQARLPELAARSLTNYADYMEAIADGDRGIIERVRIARQASLDLQD